MPADAISSITGGARAVTAALHRAGEATGVSFDVLLNMAKRESALDPNARASTSSAAGLFQFIEQTWLATVKKYGARHGLADAAAAIEKAANGAFTVADGARRAAILNLRFDPEKASLLAGELIQENRAGLERRLGRAVNAAEIYAAHFLGVGGAAKLLSAPRDANAAALLPSAAAANRPVFYAGARAKSVGEVMASIAKSMGEAAGPQAKAAPPLETKGVAAGWSAGRIAPPERFAAPVAERAVRSAPQWRDAPAFAAISSSPSLSPLALAVLQALDPSEIGADRRDGLQRRR